jgi:excisionase family DNA binding protein
METLTALHAPIASVIAVAETELLTPQEFAARLKITLRTVYRWLDAGKIPGARKYETLWRIPASAIDAMGKGPDKEK